MQNKDGELADKRNQIRLLEDQIALLKGTNASLLDRLSDLSVISKSGAESINKSLQAISEQSKYIQDLTGQMQRKDSLSLSLVNTLKRSLSDINDQDLTIEVKKGVVYVSISDKLLFRSGSHDINDRAQSVLGKVASVLNDHNDIDVLVEGHTDNLSISNSCTIDNWDLSVRRATSVVRYLQQKHQVDPKRMTAGGRGEFSPKVDNDSATGRQANRRTEIIITPKLDQFFNLLSSPESKN
jgi:chemotaxis protein MotB